MIGRSPMSDIVLQDELCSREQCEIFLSRGSWILRDRGSRNGTFVGGQRISEDWPLEEGQVVQVGNIRLKFTRNAKLLTAGRSPEQDTAIGIKTQRILKDLGDSRIVEALQSSRYRPDRLTHEQIRTDAPGHSLTELYRMAIESASARDVSELSSIVLKGLLSATGADIGAVLLLPADEERSPSPARLEVRAYLSLTESEYERVSDSLSRLTLKKRQAFLTEDVSSNSQLQLAQTGSLDELAARSAICAPIRTPHGTRGLIHLYSTNAEHWLTGEELHLTLAVADHMAAAMRSLEERESLQVNLQRAETENRDLRRHLLAESELVGDSESLLNLRGEIARIAPTGALALIRGESGVGKELVARAIHLNSQRHTKPFVCMNCAALSESLLESELFGHEKGAFTGATDLKIGKFEQADGGTLFLDEVGEMSQGIQAKFLRVLEGHAFERVGGHRPIEVDVRVVAATNRDLEEAVQRGLFRRDLYYRLHVAQIEIDPLRHRREDVPQLARFFLERFAQKGGQPALTLTPEAVELLTRYDWPGNVRELQNTIERAAILCGGSVVDVADIRLSNLDGKAATSAAAPGHGSEGYCEQSLDQLERKHILATLEHTDWNKTRAAQILGIERSTLDRKLKRYKVARPSA